jgi:hypothetical protein
MSGTEQGGAQLEPAPPAPPAPPRGEPGPRPCWPAYIGCKRWRVVTLGFRVGDRSRGRYATPADFALHDCSPCRGLRVRRESLGFVHRSRAIRCRAVPNQKLRFATAVAHPCVTKRRWSARAASQRPSPVGHPRATYRVRRRWCWAVVATLGRSAHNAVAAAAAARLCFAAATHPLGGPAPAAGPSPAACLRCVATAAPSTRSRME